MQKASYYGYAFLFLIGLFYFCWNPYFNYYENADIKTLLEVCNRTFGIKTSPNLKCYLRKFRGSLDIFREPTKVEVLNWQPFMAVYHNVFTKKEIEKRKKKIYRLHFEKAMAFGKYGFKYHSHSRSGTEAWLLSESEVAETWNKINLATGLTVDPYRTEFKVLSYRKGDFYRLHHDSHAFQRLQQKPIFKLMEALLHPVMRVYNNCGLGRIPRPPWQNIFNCLRNSVKRYSSETLPTRLGTVILPVTEWENGGETIFPEMELKLKLSLGSFAFFMTLFPNGVMDERHLHGACPLLSDDVKILMQGRVRLDGHVIQGGYYVF